MIRELKFTDKDSIAVIAPHPDDECLGVSAALLKAADRTDVFVLTDGSHGVTVGFKGYRWLAFWSPNAPFVCIEPWFSHTDFEEVRVPFEEREGTLFLEANGTWSAEYTITVW